MPWLSDDTTDGGSSGQKTALEGQPSRKLEAKPSLAMGDGVKYIPSQMDPLAGATATAARQDPIWLMIQDLGVLLRLLLYTPLIISPFFTRDKDAELYPSIANIKVGFLQALLALIQLLFLVMVIPAFVSLPGGAFLAGTVLCCLACYLLTLPMQGPPINHSNMDDSTKALAGQHKSERWVFVNGICTGHSTLQLEIDCLSKTFGRAVIGIHNKSYGIFADVGMCMIQRAVSYHDYGSRLTYAYLKAMLVDPTVTKVVLIAHSQGGIIISQAIDDLLSQLPANTMSKLEVYTFGSAASHFSNPSLTFRRSLSRNQPAEQSSLKMSRSNVDLLDTNQSNHVIPHMEHYANEYDLVPRWGVLHSVQDVLDTRYAGSIFVRVGASGHMFNQHYLSPMLLLSKRQTQVMAEKKGRTSKLEVEAASHVEDQIGDFFGDHFLNRTVSLDKGLATRRDLTVLAEMGVMRRESGLEFGSGQVLKDPRRLPNGKDGSDEYLTLERTASDQVVTEEARGKTVKELSRLWRYLGGKSPVDHDHKGDGYHDRSPHGNSKYRLSHHSQHKADQETGDGPVPEQPISPIISAVFDRPHSPFPRPRSSDDEQSSHWIKEKQGRHDRRSRASTRSN